jgi:hypothetical protein
MREGRPVVDGRDGARSGPPVCKFRTTLGDEDHLKIVTTLCNFVEFFCTVLEFNLSSEFQKM